MMWRVVKFDEALDTYVIASEQFDRLKAAVAELHSLDFRSAGSFAIQEMPSGEIVLDGASLSKSA